MPRQHRTSRSCGLLGRRVEYTVVRTVGRRSVHLVVVPTGLEVRVPYRFPIASVEGFLHEHGEWVLRELDSIADRARELVAGARIPVLGRELELVLGRSTRPRVRRTGERLFVSRGPGVREALERWFRSEARRHFAQRIDVLAPAFGGRRPSTVSVRGQRTRWGSCTAGGTISLNWRLLQLEPELVDYVVAHELCHLVHLDHSVRFWELLARGMPDYARHRQALKHCRQLVL